MKYTIITLLTILCLASCSTFNTSGHSRTSHHRDTASVADLQRELSYKDAYIDSLHSEIDYLNFQLDSLFTEVEILSSKVLINEGFEIPNRYSFAGVSFDLTSDRVRTKLKDIFDREVRSASQFIPRSGIYWAVFDSILTQNDIHPDVKYLAVAESHLNSMAVSVASAGGMWQFIPSTARLYNLKIDSYVDERRHIFKATEAACKYLHQAHAQLKANGVNDWLLTLAAYNSGVGNITRSIREQGGNDFFSLILRVEETNNYIWRAIAIKMIFEFEEVIFEKKFERMTPLLEANEIKTLTTEGYYDLAEWATAQGTNANTIWELNTWINISRSRTGRFSQINHLIIPPGTYDILVPRNAIPDTAKVREIETKFLVKNNSAFITGASQTHKVVRGENLGSIARRYGVTVNDIKRWNNLKSDLIREGQTLHLQARQSSSSATTSTTSSSTSTRKYTVKSGDTLSQIAERLGVTTRYLMEKNNLQYTSVLRIGQVLEY